MTALSPATNEEEKEADAAAASAAQQQQVEQLSSQNSSDSASSSTQIAGNTPESRAEFSDNHVPLSDTPVSAATQSTVVDVNTTTQVIECIATTTTPNVENVSQQNSNNIVERTPPSWRLVETCSHHVLWFRTALRPRKQVMCLVDNRPCARFKSLVHSPLFLFV